jgi:hypothetical protein
MHPQHILARLVVVDHLGPLHHAVGPEVAGAGSRQQGTNIRPLNEVLPKCVNQFLQIMTSRYAYLGRVAVDVLKAAAPRLVFADHVVHAINLNQARAMGLQRLAVGLDTE